MNGEERALRDKNFDISFRKKLMTSSYQIYAPPVSSLFNSAEFKNKGISENRQRQ